MVPADVRVRPELLEQGGRCKASACTHSSPPTRAAPRLLAIAAGAAGLEHFTAYATEAPKAQVGPP